MKKIIKCGGYCTDGCQWNNCGFLKIEEENTNILEYHGNRYHPTINNYASKKKYKRICTLFHNLELTDGSLMMCNKIYGLSYEGRP